MKALVVCPTYGRPHLLGRILASFIEQTYDDKHLVIINDDPNVTLCCDYKDVSIINCSDRLSIGEKRNLGASYGHYDVIHPWDDDDIFLPKRLENHMVQYDDVDVNAYRNFPSYITYGSKFNVCDGGPNSISYRKKQFYEIGGYSVTENYGEDTELHDKLKGLKRDRIEENRDFIYSFSTSNYHASCQFEDTHLQKIAYDELVKMDILNKKYYILPDYDQYNVFRELDKLYREKKEDISIKHLGDCKIEIIR